MADSRKKMAEHKRREQKKNCLRLRAGNKSVLVAWQTKKTFLLYTPLLFSQSLLLILKIRHKIDNQHKSQIWSQNWKNVKWKRRPLDRFETITRSLKFKQKKKCCSYSWSHSECIPANLGWSNNQVQWQLPGCCFCAGRSHFVPLHIGCDHFGHLVRTILMDGMAAPWQHS